MSPTKVDKSHLTHVRPCALAPYLIALTDTPRRTPATQKHGKTLSHKLITVPLERALPLPPPWCSSPWSPFLIGPYNRRQPPSRCCWESCSCGACPHGRPRTAHPLVCIFTTSRCAGACVPVLVYIHPGCVHTCTVADSIICSVSLFAREERLSSAPEREAGLRA